MHFLSVKFFELLNLLPVQFFPVFYIFSICCGLRIMVYFIINGLLLSTYRCQFFRAGNITHHLAVVDIIPDACPGKFGIPVYNSFKLFIS